MVITILPFVHFIWRAYVSLEISNYNILFLTVGRTEGGFRAAVLRVGMERGQGVSFYLKAINMSNRCNSLLYASGI